MILALVVISLLTTTTLGAVAITFDRLMATNRIKDSEVAKTAADAGLADFVASGGQVTPSPKGFNLSRNEAVDVGSSTDSFRPNPRESVYSVESNPLNLPRCVAVGVLSPWVNEGKYLFSTQQTNNPALIFNYANIVNDTLLGTVPDNYGKLSNNTDRQTPINALTQLGQFYNPYAPLEKSPTDPTYWTIKMGGPQDQFLNKRSPDDANKSYYKDLDFLYLPALPRWQDSGLLNIQGSGLERKSASELRALFEGLIVNSGLRLWVDGSMSDDMLYKYGLGDLFTDTPNNQITWLQPSLWNDLAEGDLATNSTGNGTGLMGPWISDSSAGDKVASETVVSWTKGAQPLKTGGVDSGYQTEIFRGARSFAFLYRAEGSNRSLSPNAILSFNYYGSLDGLRLNQEVTLSLLDSAQQPLALENRDSQAQGLLYRAKITKITTGSATLELTLSGDTLNTAKLADGSRYPKVSDISTIYLNAGLAKVISPSLRSWPLISTTSSLTGVTINPNAAAGNANATFSANSCQISASSFTVCPAVGDLISLKKTSDPSAAPTWGQVTAVYFDGTGKAMTGFTLDKFRLYPKPVMNMAHTSFTDIDGVAKIAYYGGEIVSNKFDGGFNVVRDELWVYTPSTNSWSFWPNTELKPPESSGGGGGGALPPPGGGGSPGVNAPGRLAGASFAYDQTNGDRRLVLFGGYRYEGKGTVNVDGANQSCASDGYYTADCLVANRPAGRIAKTVSNSVYTFDLNSKKWKKQTVDSSSGPSGGDSLNIRVVSRFADRAGKPGWSRYAQVTISAANPLELNVSAGAETALTIYPRAIGFAVGDEVILTGLQDQVGGVNADFKAWARVTALSGTGLSIKVYGYQGTGGATTVRLLSLKLTTLNQQAVLDTTCVWQADSTCIATDPTGLSVGDGVILEKYLASPSKLEKGYSGYITKISGNRIWFSSTEPTDDYKDGTAPSSISASPIPRFGASFSYQDKGIYLWQGAQSNKESDYASDVWYLKTKDNSGNVLATPEWQYREANLTYVSGATTIETIAMPTTVNVFSANSVSESSMTVTCQGSDGVTKTLDQKSGVNTAMVKDVWEKRSRNSVDSENRPITVVECVPAWDNNRSWTIEITEEGNPSWNVQRLAKGSKIVVQRNSTSATASRPLVQESFHGLVDNITFSANGHTQITVKHRSGYEEEGISGNAANTRIELSVPGYVNNYALKVEMSADNPRTLKATVSSDPSKLEALSKLPAGARVVAYGSNTYATALVGKRETVLNGSNVQEVHLIASGPAYMNTPPPITYGVGGLVKSGNVQLISMANTRAQTANQLPQWIYNASPNKWETQFAPSSTNQPSPRTGGTAASAGTNGDQIFLVGGASGLFTDLWRLKDVGTGNGGTWQLGKASHLATQSLPNLTGGALDVINNQLFYFGGKQQLTFNSLNGAHALGTPNVSGLNEDGSYVINGAAANTQFRSLIYDSNSTSTVKKSLQLVNGYLNSVQACRYYGQAGCDGQLMRGLGTLGSGSTIWGRSLAVVNPGSYFRLDNSSPANRSLIYGAPSRSLASTNQRWEQEGYYPYQCDTGGGGCLATTLGSLSSANESSSTKTMMLAGYARFFGDTSTATGILITPAGIGLGIASSSNVGITYCAQSAITNPVNPSSASDYTCSASAPKSRYLTIRPDSEDLAFLFNASKILSAARSAKIVGYYGGVRRGYWVSGAGDTIREIAP